MQRYWKRDIRRNKETHLVVQHGCLFLTIFRCAPLFGPPTLHFPS